ncbi:MAG: hypothetical protein P1U40_00345 [Coxiellaceae bacterium]|nr:hypothetical protein [Coxiellaceae bacterium]
MQKITILALYCCLLVIPLNLAWAYAPLVIINKSGQKLGLQNSGYPIPNKQGEFPPIITICPQGGSSASCPSSIELQMNNPNPTDGSYFWQYLNNPENYYVVIRGNKFLTGNSLCPTSKTLPLNPDCLYCLGSVASKNPVDQYGVATVPVGKEHVLVIEAHDKQPRCHFIDQPTTPPPAQAPYQVIDVGRSYTLAGAHPSSPQIPNKDHPIMNLQPYFNAQNASTIDKNGNSLITVDKGPLQQYLIVGQGNSYPGRLYVKRNIETLTDTITSQCRPYTPHNQSKPDPYKYVCPVSFTAASGPKVKMNIIVNGGIRAYGMSELLTKTIGATDRNTPYFVEVSAKPSDATNKNTTLCKNSQNPNGGTLIAATAPFFSPGQYISTTKNTNILYSFDASSIANSPASTNIEPTGKDAIRLITAINAMHYNFSKPVGVNTGDFYLVPITHDNKFLAAICYSGNSFSAGIYQINIKAQGQTSGINDPGEIAFATFYLNVNSGNPSLAEWHNDKYPSAKTNIFNNDYGQGPHPIIGAYTYSNTDAGNDINNFLNTYENYAKDLAKINENRTQPINTIFAQIMGIQYSLPNENNPTAYLSSSSYWPVCQDPAANSASCSGMNNDPTQNLKADWVNFDQPTLSTWLPKLSTALGETGLTNNLAFTNAVKADFSSYNPTQQMIVADKIVSTLNMQNVNIDGITLDLEGGFNSPGAVDFYKAVADRLAFQGKFFGIYYFSTMFTPDVIASFGPLGQALISGYDISSYRVTPSSKAPNSINTYGNWQGQEKYLTNAYQNSISCSSAITTPYRNKSWCNINSNGAYAEGYRLWNSSFSNSYWSCAGASSAVTALCTPAKAFATLNGKFQIVMAVSQSSTLWSAIELFNPDLTQFTAKPNTGQCNIDPLPTGQKQPIFCQPQQQGFILANTIDPSSKKPSGNPWGYGGNNACSQLDNTWFKTNSASLYASNPTPDQQKIQNQLKECIFQNVEINVNNAKVPVQSYSSCGKNPQGEPIPYNQCIAISSLPGNLTPAGTSIGPSNQVSYIKNIIGIFKSDSDEGSKYSGFSNNFVGVSMYALENFQSGPNTGAYLCGTAYNPAITDDKIAMFAVQQPLYVGSTIPENKSTVCGTNHTPTDPYYFTPEYQKLLSETWDAFFGIMNN